MMNSQLLSLQVSITGSHAYRLSASSMMGSLGNAFFIFLASLLKALVLQSCLRFSSLRPFFPTAFSRCSQ